MPRASISCSAGSFSIAAPPFLLTPDPGDRPLILPHGGLSWGEYRRSGVKVEPPSAQGVAAAARLQGVPVAMLPQGVAAAARTQGKEDEDIQVTKTKPPS